MRDRIRKILTYLLFHEYIKKKSKLHIFQNLFDGSFLIL